MFSPPNEQSTEEGGSEVDATLPDISIIAPEHPSGHSLDVSGTDLGAEIELPSFSIRNVSSPYQLMGLRDGDLFVCINSPGGPILRTINVRDWKKAISTNGTEDIETSIGQVEYKEVDISRINFHVRKMEFNGTGKMLALMGDHAVSVLLLPISFKTYSKSDVIPCRILNIGTMCYATDHSKTVAKVLWHPLSEAQSHLLVLSSDGFLRMYNVNLEIEEPEQSFHFLDPSLEEDERDGPGVMGAGLYAADRDESELVSFCFGGGTIGGWDPLAVYGLTKSGDLYSICPVMPLQSIFTKSQLEDLRTSVHGVGDHPDKAPSYSERQQYWRKRWVEELLEDLDQERYLRALPDAVFPVGRPRVGAKLTAERRGPYSIEPTPIPESGYGIGCDIISLNVKSLNVLALSFDSGMVYVCTELDAAEPGWKLSDTAPETLPKLALHEHLDFSIGNTSKKSSSMSLVQDRKYTDSFFCCHAAGIHYVNLAPWGDSLEGGGTRYAGSVTWLVNTRPLDTRDATSIIGFGVVNDVYLGYGYLLWASTHQAHGELLSLRALDKPNVKRINANSETPATGTGPISLYTQVLRPPPYGVPEALTNRSRQPMVKLPPGDAAQTYPSFITDETVAFFEAQVERMRADLKMLYNAGTQLQERFELQCLELKAQSTASTAASQKLAKLIARMHTSEARCNRIAKYQPYLSRKTDLILQVLVDHMQPQLSDEERKYMNWVDELKTKHREKLKPRVSQYEKEKDVLKTELQFKKLKLDAKGPAFCEIQELGTNQTERIKGALKEIYGIIVQVKKLEEQVKRMERSARERMAREIGGLAG
ncbi:hypothetical protein HK104_003147 [Borealophlyctis nickersoniae]|nr:hypothetical protein HK104_003147 [Borealophlyctis nickersoniae]